MSEAIVFSDVHGDAAALAGLFARAREIGASRAYFAGDMGLRSPEVQRAVRGRGVPLLYVQGNCDSPWDWTGAGLPPAPLFLVSSLNGREIFLSHGHRCAVPEDAGLRRAEGMVVITGHTHLPLLRREGGVFLLNPGSLGRPRGRWGASYAIIGEDSIRIEELGSGAEVASLRF